MTNVDKSNWWLVGWDGITLTVPDDWNIGAIGGNRDEGYLRLDSPDMSRVEIKWAQAKGFPDIAGIVDKYLRDLQKDKKKPAEVDRKLELYIRRKQRHKSSVECFGWQSDTQGFGAAWFCADCGKTVIVQVMGTLQEPVRKWADQIINDLTDHPEGEYVTWATYGFQVDTPTRFKLTGQQLMAGLISLTLTHDNEHLHLARWGMASVALKNKSLREWGQKELNKRVKKFTHELTEETFRGHECLGLDGKTNLPQEQLMSFVQHCLGKPFPDRIKGYLWHCQDENKIFYIEGILDRENLGLMDEIRNRLPCHGPDA